MEGFDVKALRAFRVSFSFKNVKFAIMNAKLVNISEWKIMKLPFARYFVLLGWYLVSQARNEKKLLNYG